MRTAPLAMLLITALCLVGTASAADEAPPTVPEALKLQQRARAQMRNIEYELAIPLLARAQTAAPARRAKPTTIRHATVATL